MNWDWIIRVICIGLVVGVFFVGTADGQDR